MRVIAYCRVSTARQADEGVSLDAQRARVAAWATGSGNSLDPADVFVDAGISGKRADNRPALKAALEAACSGGCVLVVYSLSRLARSVRDTLAIAERLAVAGADLVSLSESIETISAAGKMVFRMLAVLAEFERDLISERTRGVVAHKRAKGERLGTVPYGHDLAADGMTLVESPQEQRAIRFMVALRGEGYSLSSIAFTMLANGFRPRTSAGWRKSSIASILKRAGDPEA
jgi:site-specific DNA recombinase